MSLLASFMLFERIITDQFRKSLFVAGNEAREVKVFVGAVIAKLEESQNGHDFNKR